MNLTVLAGCRNETFNILTFGVFDGFVVFMQLIAWAKCWIDLA
jgi:hypothetical protein